MIFAGWWSMVSEGVPPPQKQHRGCFLMNSAVFMSCPRINYKPRMTKLNPLCNPINKLEAARRQLDCAIRLYLADEDILSIHTLAYAALTVLTNYDEKTNKGCVWGKIIRDHPHHWSREIANFLKHADRDPLAEIPDVPECVPEYLLHMCARLYVELAGAPTREMEVMSTLMDIKFKWEKEAEAERDRWDSYYDEDLMLETAQKTRITSKSLRDAGRKMLSGEFPS